MIFNINTKETFPIYYQNEGDHFGTSNIARCSITRYSKSLKASLRMQICDDRNYHFLLSSHSLPIATAKNWHALKPSFWVIIWGASQAICFPRQHVWFQVDGHHNNRIRRQNIFYQRDHRFYSKDNAYYPSTALGKDA